MAVVPLLLDAEADINTKSHNGRIPLQEAVKNGHLNVVRMLLGTKADVNAQKHGSE